MKLLLDENLSRRIVSLIASHYPGSSQVTLLGLERASDTAIWAYARQHDFIIVTKDSDFLAIAQNSLTNDVIPPGVIFITDDYLPIGQCIADLELVAKVYDINEVMGRILFLPLR